MARVTIRITLAGVDRPDVGIKLRVREVGQPPGDGTWLCGPYGGEPICTAGRSYDTSFFFAPGTHVEYSYGIDEPNASYFETPYSLVPDFVVDAAGNLKRSNYYLDP